MLSSLPPEIRQVFDRFITTEYVTLDARSQPIAWPVTPYVHPKGDCVDVTTGLGYPKKARDAQANPHVALLFSEPLGSGLDTPPMVLVQGKATVDETDLDANRERYERESAIKLPATKSAQPPKPLRRFFLWYYARIYVHVRPERVWVWSGGDVTVEPHMYLADQEEVRSGHPAVPEVELPAVDGGANAWDPRLDGQQSGVLAIEAPDGFPFAVRVPVRPDAGRREIRLGADPVGAPLEPGLACFTFHQHSPDFSWQRNFQVRGDLARDDDGWYVAPHKIVGGFEVPPGGIVAGLRENWSKMQRYRAVAKREMAGRS
jgi:hypothetical protein